MSLGTRGAPSHWHSGAYSSANHRSLFNGLDSYSVGVMNRQIIQKRGFSVDTFDYDSLASVTQSLAFTQWWRTAWTFPAATVFVSFRRIRQVRLRQLVFGQIHAWKEWPDIRDMA